MDRDKEESYDILVESLKGDTKDFLTRKYIELNKLSFPGFSVQKLIDKDLISTKENKRSYCIP